MTKKTIEKVIEDSRDIHNYVGKIEAFKKYLADSKLSKKNQETILEYQESFRNKSKATLMKNLQVVFQCLKEIGKDIDKITEEDMKKWVKEIYDRKDEGRYTSHTTQKLLVCAKRFFRVYYKMPKSQFPECVRFIETEQKHEATKSADDLPTPLEIKKVLESGCLNNRDRLIITLLYDCGMRIGELGGLNIEDIDFPRDEENNSIETNHMVVRIMKSKTAQRSIITSLAVLPLKKWLAEHPQVDGKKSPLFVRLGHNNQNKRLQYRAFTKTIEECFQRAKIEKDCNPHAFRHTVYTRISPTFEWLTDYWFGHKTKMSSSMASIYGHYDWKQCIEPYFKALDSVKSMKELIPILCDCGFLNSPGSSGFCLKCGNELSENTILGLKPKTGMEKAKTEFINMMMKDKGMDLQKYWDEKFKVYMESKNKNKT